MDVQSANYGVLTKFFIHATIFVVYMGAGPNLVNDPKLRLQRRKLVLQLPNTKL